MTKSDYEKLLKRIEKNISKTEQSEQRFKLPPADVSWEGKKTYLRNFIEFPKALRREPEKILQYLTKEFAVPVERIGDKVMFIGRRDPEDFTRLFQIYLKVPEGFFYVIYLCHNHKQRQYHNRHRYY